jgi:hypothetical protein
MKKILITTLSILALFQLKAQEKEINVLNVFDGKFEGLDGIYILNDGTVQLTNMKRIFKLDADGKKIGEPERVPPTISNSTSITSESLRGHFPDRDLRFNRFGESIEFTYMKSDAPNEVYDVPFKQMKGVTSSGTSAKAANVHSNSSGVQMVDDYNAVYYASYTSKSEKSHGKQKFPSNKTYTFLQIVRINIKEKKTEEVYTCIDLVPETREVYNDVEFKVLHSDENRLILGLRKSKSVLRGGTDGYIYDLRESSKGVFEWYSLDLKSLELEKIQSVEFSTPATAFNMNYSYTTDGIKVNWVEPISGTPNFSLHCSTYTLEEGASEVEESTIHFPTDIVALMKPIPLPITDYTDLNNKKWSFIQGNFVKSKRDKNPLPMVVMLDEEGTIEFKNGHEEHSVWEFAFYDKELKRMRFLSLERDVEGMGNLVDPLLSESSMNYMAIDDRVVVRKIGSEIVVVHCDYRGSGAGTATRLSDFKMVIGKI